MERGGHVPPVCSTTTRNLAVVHHQTSIPYFLIHRPPCSQEDYRDLTWFLLCIYDLGSFILGATTAQRGTN